MSRPVPRESASRCALQAQLRGDPMIGTAPPAARLLLVEQPGAWGPRGLLDSRAEPRVAERIDQLAAAAGLRLQAVRQPGRHARRIDSHVVGVVDTTTRKISHWRVPDLRALLAQLEASAVPEDAPPDPAAALTGLLTQPADLAEDDGPLYLVCTHGRHDACCALRGRPLAAALHELRPGRVWETTHVGGDRFAANLLVLPWGEVYGRVLPFAADDLVAHVERGEVVPGLMRGRLGLAPIAQAALVYAYEQLALDQRDTLSVVGMRRLDDEQARVTLDSPDGPMVVQIAMGWEGPNQLTCRGPATARARVYRGVRITAAD